MGYKLEEVESVTFGNEPEMPFKLYQQIYGKEGDTKQVICLCGCKQFEVGCGSYFTVVRCCSCGRECCVHEG